MPPPPPITATATLHALTERLASHGQTLSPLFSSKFASSLANFNPSTLAAAAAQYRQPAPPPALPVLQLVGRHQEAVPPPPPPKDGSKQVKKAPAYPYDQDELPPKIPGEKCPFNVRWSGIDEHLEVRCATMDENDLEGFVADMAIVMRREYDCWVEQCW